MAAIQGETGEERCVRGGPAGLTWTGPGGGQESAVSLYSAHAGQGRAGHSHDLKEDAQGSDGVPE